jgi:hypothetical protein
LFPSARLSECADTVHRTSLRPLARTAHGSARPFGAGRHSKDRYNRHHCAFGRRVRRRSVAVLYEGGPAPRWRASACSLLVARGMPREGRYKRSSHWPGPERLEWAACALRMTEVCAHMRESIAGSIPVPDIHGCKSAKLAAVSKPVESHGSLPPIRKARPAVRPAAQGQLRGSSDGGGMRGAPWARVSPVPARMWVGRAQSRCRCSANP